MPLFERILTRLHGNHLLALAVVLTFLVGCGGTSESRSVQSAKSQTAERPELPDEGGDVESVRNEVPRKANQELVGSQQSPQELRELLSFPVLHGRPGVSRDQTIKLALVGLESPLTVWAEGEDTKMAFQTPYELTADEVQSLKALLLRAQSHQTMGTEGTIWSAFRSVPVSPEVPYPALTNAVKAMGLVLPTEVSVSINAENSIWLISRCPGPLKYFSVQTETSGELLESPTETSNQGEE